MDNIIKELIKIANEIEKVAGKRSKRRSDEAKETSDFINKGLDENRKKGKPLPKEVRDQLNNSMSGSGWHDTDKKHSNKPREKNTKNLMKDDY